MANLISKTGWVKFGNGTISVNSTTGALSVTPGSDQSITSAIQTITTEVGKQYQITWELQTATQMWRSLGTTRGSYNIVARGMSVVSENKLTFTATTTSVVLEFYRSGTGTPTVGSVRCDEVSPGASSARRLNGRNQYFRLNNGTAGLRTANSNWYIGGWFKFSWLPPTGTIYIMDFGDPNTSLTTYARRIRIAWDTGTTKLFLSTNSTDLSNYYEHHRIITLAEDTWYYVGAIVHPDRDIELVINNLRGTTYVGTVIPPASNLCTVLQLGARGGTVSGYAPVILSDWVWCSDFLPTDNQILALAAGYKPEDVEDFSPTYHWKMTASGTTEASVADAASMTATNSPISVVGPTYLVPEVAVPLPLIFF